MPAHPLNGAKHKIKRAKENIRNLNGEIATFLESARYTVVGKFNPNGLVVSTSGPKASPRIRVLIGEVAHNLRSSLSYIAWQLVLAGRGTPTKDTDFPVVQNPAEYPAVSKRRIEAWPDPGAEDIVRNLQPFNHVPPEDSPLLILHKMNITDKHHLPVATVAQFDVSLQIFTALSAAKNDAAVRAGHSEVKMDDQQPIDIVFPKFGTRQNQPVIPSLTMLAQFVETSIYGQIFPFFR